ncbi:MAG TPA: hypothetical protein VMG38_18675 [Trebonia sp.]|nr:hypothetical protein [Trebonia sp.]
MATAAAPTAPPPAGLPPAGPAGRTPPAGRRRAPARGGLRRWISEQRTPAAMRLSLALLVILSLAWGGLGAWTVAQHSSAASSLAHTDEPSSFYAQQLYLNIAQADVTITTAFLTVAQPVAPGAAMPSTLQAREKFEADLASASHDLAAIQGSSTSAAFSKDVASIASGLATYRGDVASAESQYSDDDIPAGDSFMEVASEDAHLTLLPSAQDIYRIENDAVAGSKGQATSLLTLLIAVVVAVGALLALLRVQRWLARRTRRVLNLGLVLATTALVISVGWLAVTFGIANSDLSTAIGQGANPAQSLAQASIDIQQIRGDSILNVIARSGTTTLQADSAAQQANVHSLLGGALAAGNGQASPAIRAAMAATPSWYAANAKGYTDASTYDFSGEQGYVDSAASGYSGLEADVSDALRASQATFTSQADTGASAFGPLEAIVIVAAVLMAAASAWGMSRRLAEYR